MNKKILIASVLKPVDDVRHYEKLALSIAKANKYQIIILGKGTEKKSLRRDITFRPSGHFGRKSIKRPLIQVKLWANLLHYRPCILIITTPELLPAAALAKAVFGYQLIYDVQENYQSNLKHQNVYSALERKLALPLLGFLESFFTRWVDWFTLAEKSYAEELKFLRNDFIVVENKSAIESSFAPPRWSVGERLNLIFSGTLSEYSGIHRAIQVFERLNRTSLDVELTVIGVYHNPKIKNFLEKESAGNRDIKLLVSDQPISHEQIVQALAQSHLAIIGYHPDQVNENRIPTKMFEYAGMGLPYLLQNHPTWVERSSELGGAIIIDFENFEPEKIVFQLENMKEWDHSKSRWREESTQIQNLINQLIKNH